MQKISLQVVLAWTKSSPSLPLTIDVDACGEFLPRQPSVRQKFHPAYTALQAQGTSCSAWCRKWTQRLSRALRADLGLYLYSFQYFYSDRTGPVSPLDSFCQCSRLMQGIKLTLTCGGRLHASLYGGGCSKKFPGRIVPVIFQCISG